MNTNYIYTNLTYRDKEIMSELNNMNLEPKYIVGQYMESFCLYNDYIPVVNYQDEMKEMLLENKELYYFDYSDNWSPGMTDYIENFLWTPNYHLVKYKEFERSIKTLGINRNVALYKVELIE